MVICAILKVFFHSQIAKNRYSGDLGIMPLDFDKQSLSYAQKPKKKVEATSESLPEQGPAVPEPLPLPPPEP